MTQTTGNQNSNHHRLIILGSGPAGLTAAIYAARANLKPLLVHGPLQGGQLTTTTDVENFPGFEHGIMGPDLMSTMEKQAARFGTVFRQEIVESIESAKRPFTLKTSSGTVLTCDALIIATGAAPKLIGLPEEKELMGYGVSTCATCDGAFFRNKAMAVVGGGDSACEEANFLTKFGSVVYLIHRRHELRASKIMQDRVLANPKIKMVWNSEVRKITGTKKDGVKSLELFNHESKSTTTLEVDALFVAIGHTPNSALVRNSVAVDEGGYIKVEPHSSKTNIPGLFACGDVQDHVYRQAITAAGTGCMAAIDAERFLGH